MEWSLRNRTCPKVYNCIIVYLYIRELFSCSEWSPQLQFSTGLLILTSERWLAHVTPQCIAPLSLTSEFYLVHFIS